MLKSMLFGIQTMAIAQSSSSSILQTKDGQGKRSAKSKKQKALQAKKEAKLKKMQRKLELERRNAELKRLEKQNNEVDTSSISSKKKKKKKKKRKWINIINKTSIDEDVQKNTDDIVSGDTKTSTTTSVISDDSSNNDKNKLLTTESDEDDNAGSEYDNVNSDNNNRSLSDSSFVKQESNIFILDKAKLQQIVAMGFPDIDLNATALFESNNNVEQAIEIILKKTAKVAKRKKSQETRNNNYYNDKESHEKRAYEKGTHDKGLPNEEDRPVNYKSKLCQNIIQYGSCRYGKSCHYAHSKAELESCRLDPKIGQRAEARISGPR